MIKTVLSFLGRRMFLEEWDHPIPWYHEVKMMAYRTLFRMIFMVAVCGLAALAVGLLAVIYLVFMGLIGLW
jgi:hypothetical protein